MANKTERIIRIYNRLRRGPVTIDILYKWAKQVGIEISQRQRHWEFPTVIKQNGSDILSIFFNIADLVRRSKLVITHDPGLMHIAAAFKKKIISIWRNTVPEFGMAPYYGTEEINNVIAEIKNLSCRPCSKIGYDKCPRGHFKCMEMQDIEGVAQKALMML